MHGRERGPLKAVRREPDGMVAVWLVLVAVMVGLMVIIGGMTRLTGSGLSMVEWRPLLGILPPLSQEEWARVFSLYQASPEYRQVNSWMGLDEFRRIFWWEYLHRLWGRLIGLVYAVPFLWFLARGSLPGRLRARCWLLLVLGAVQGLIGWWMVRSGLVDDPHVSPLRLAVHLSLAFVILGIVVWTVLDLRSPVSVNSSKGLVRHADLCLGLVGLTVLAGALVAGLDGGRVYNTFPLMGGSLVPPDYGHLGSVWRTLVEDPGSAQFHHRVLALVTVAAGVVLLVRASGPGISGQVKAAAGVLAGLVLVQSALGIATLLSVADIDLAILHQAGAVALFVTAVVLAHRVRA